MSEKSELYRCEGTMLTYDAGVLLGQIADGLRQGKLTITCDCGTICLDMPDGVGLEAKVKEKAKSDGLKRKCVIELAWREAAPGK